jgi:predicted ATPase
VGRDGAELLHELLSDPLRPTALVLEDVHWADEATLDVVRFLGRRIARLPAILVLTYRRDVLEPDHPLHRVLGGLQKLRVGTRQEAAAFATASGEAPSARP